MKNGNGMESRPRIAFLKSDASVSVTARQFCGTVESLVDICEWVKTFGIRWAGGNLREITLPGTRRSETVHVSDWVVDYGENRWCVMEDKLFKENFR